MFRLYPVSLPPSNRVYQDEWKRGKLFSVVELAEIHPVRPLPSPLSLPDVEQVAAVSSNNKNLHIETQTNTCAILVSRL